MTDELRFAVKCGSSSKKLQVSATTAVKSLGEKDSKNKKNQKKQKKQETKKQLRKARSVSSDEIRVEDEKEMLDGLTPENVIVCKNKSNSNLSLTNPGLLIVEKEESSDEKAPTVVAFKANSQPTIQQQILLAQHLNKQQQLHQQQRPNTSTRTNNNKSNTKHPAITFESDQDSAYELQQMPKSLSSSRKNVQHQQHDNKYATTSYHHQAKEMPSEDDYNDNDDDDDVGNGGEMIANKSRHPQYQQPPVPHKSRHKMAGKQLPEQLHHPQHPQHQHHQLQNKPKEFFIDAQQIPIIVDPNESSNESALKRYPSGRRQPSRHEQPLASSRSHSRGYETRTAIEHAHVDEDETSKTNSDDTATNQEVEQYEQETINYERYLTKVKRPGGSSKRGNR